MCKNSLKTVKYIDAQTYLSSGVDGIEFVTNTEKEIKTLTDETIQVDEVKALYENAQVKQYIYH